MGELNQYPIRVLVTHDQEFAIRRLFEDNHWSCSIEVLSEGIAASIRHNAQMFAFPDDKDNCEGDLSVSDKLKMKVVDGSDIRTDSETYSCDDTAISNYPETLSKDMSNAVDYTDSSPIQDSRQDTVKMINGAPDLENMVRDIEAEVTEHLDIKEENTDTVTYKSSSDKNETTDLGTLSMKQEKTVAETLVTIVNTGMEVNERVNDQNCKTPSGLIVPSGQGVPACGYIAAESPELTCVNDLLRTACRPATGILNPTCNTMGRYEILLLPEAKTENIVSRQTRENKSDKIDNKHDQNSRIRITNLRTEQAATTSTNSRDPYNGAYNFVKCIDCKLKFFKWEDLWKHRNEATHTLPDKKPHGWAKRNFSPEELQKMDFELCVVCNSYFPNRRKLRQHYFAIHRELMPVPTCPICCEEFTSYKELNEHKREKEHNDSLSLLKNYQCDTCGKNITKYENFRRHQLLFCGKSEEELEALRVYPCTVCGKRFKSDKERRIHTTNVHEVCESVCDICGKVFKSKISLRYHKYRHNEKNRKYTCEECGKAFFTKYLLAQHLRIHTKEKPYKCPLCEYACAHRVNVNKHIKNVHKQGLKAIDLRKVQS